MKMCRYRITVDNQTIEIYAVFEQTKLDVVDARLRNGARFWGKVFGLPRVRIERCKEGAK